MTLDQLRMLVKIRDTGSVLAAAEALYRTQPTVSVAIRKLEDELGVQLLDRDQYRACLTPAGETLCRKARSVIARSDELSALAEHLASGYEPELNIAIEASCPMPLILEVLKNVERIYPQTRFNLMAENIWGALSRLKEGEADLAISPWFVEDTSLESKTMLHETMIAVASPQFPPLKSGAPLVYQSMKEAVQVIVKDSSRLPKEKKIGVIEEGRHWLVNDHYTKKEILLAGMGWGRLQHHLIEKELAEGKLVPLTIRNYESTLDIEIRIARRLDRTAGPVAAELWNEFKVIC
ncbi:MAG: transcriptional regulator [Desulfuromonas sp.]|nr:MAG: transcriptional regulator [Desulfuromonas sp.]